MQQESTAVKEKPTTSQQMVNGSHYDGDITVTNRMTDRYAVVNPPEQGKHRKTEEQRERRHLINLIKRRKPREPVGLNRTYGRTAKGGPLDDIRLH